MKLISLLYEIAFQNYFEKAKTPEEAKALYRELAKKYHPDKGGDTEIMQAINNQYQDFLKHGNRLSRPTSTSTTNRPSADDYFRAGDAASKKWDDRNAERDRKYRERQAADDKAYRDRQAANDQRYKDTQNKYEKDWQDRQNRR